MGDTVYPAVLYNSTLTETIFMCFKQEDISTLSINLS